MRNEWCQTFSSEVVRHIRTRPAAPFRVSLRRGFRHRRDPVAPPTCSLPLALGAALPLIWVCGRLMKPRMNALQISPRPDKVASPVDQGTGTLHAKLKRSSLAFQFSPNASKRRGWQLGSSSCHSRHSLNSLRTPPHSPRSPAPSRSREIKTTTFQIDHATLSTRASLVHVQQRGALRGPACDARSRHSSSGRASSLASHPAVPLCACG